jgi:hypothetical protein
MRSGQSEVRQQISLISLDNISSELIHIALVRRTSISRLYLRRVLAWQLLSTIYLNIITTGYQSRERRMRFISKT